MMPAELNKLDISKMRPPELFRLIQQTYGPLFDDLYEKYKKEKQS
jgi:hypothetical protein